MIAKGTPHDSGVRLARYLTTGKEGETAALWELSGFASTDIIEAFRSVHVMAAATQCVQPFFHVQVRNPDTECLTGDQWLIVADRIERILGLAGQPRALAFHTDRNTGSEHMHLAFSRIDQDTLTARKLPFFKRRLNRVSRELEAELGLTPVRAHRTSVIKYAPLRPEEEQARRLDVDIREVLETVRGCFDRSDCGRSFVAALAHHGLALAQGERRDFMVVDYAGGVHALGKRILGVSAAQIRARLSDLARERLPTVDQVRQQISTDEGARKKQAVQKNQTARRKQKCLPTPAIDRSSRSTQAVEEIDDRLIGRAPPTAPDPTIAQYEPAFPELIPEPNSKISIDIQIEHLSRQTPDVGNEAIHSPVTVLPRDLGLVDARLAPEGKSVQSAGQKSTGLAAMLKNQFRAVVKALVKRTPLPQPRERRRRSGETVRSFQLAAGRLLRPIIQQPQVLKTLSFLNDAVPWLHLWGWIEPADNAVEDLPAGPEGNHLSPHP